MKVLKYVLGLVALGFVIAGLSILVLETDGSSLLGVDYLYTREEFTSSAAINDISIDAVNREVIITESATTTIKVQYAESVKDPISVEIENGMLIIEQLSSDWLVGMALAWNNLGDAHQIRVELPLGTYDSIHVATANGAITLMHAMNVDDIQLTSSNGRIEVSEVTMNTVVLETSNGAIVTDQVTHTGTAQITSLNGRFSDQGSAWNLVEVRLSNGDIHLDDSSGEAIDARTSNGKILMTMHQFLDTYVRSSNGDITIDYITMLGSTTLARGSMQTSNGRLYFNDGLISHNSYLVTGTGTLRFDAVTSNGTVRVS